MDIDDEKSLFRSAMADARPLVNDRISPHSKKPDPVARFTRRDEREALKESLHPAAPGILENGDEIQFQRRQISTAIMAKLKRGKYRVQEELDLHGLTANEAKAAVFDFMKEARRFRWSCVRVIHGKGKRSFQGISVLRPKVARWLSRHDDVLAFASCMETDGGTGALYVLLDN